MKDEGVGVYLVNSIAKQKLPEGVVCLDGGTGSFTLLGPMQDARKILIIDATANDKPVGHVEVLYPKYSSDYPGSLTAHDIGLKDLLDAFYLLDGDKPDVTLFAVTVDEFQSVGMGLSEELDSKLPEIEEMIRDYL